MKFDFESLSAEPLFYMLMHSGAFVTVLGAIFFIVGLMFGYATWGRYKRQTRELRGEATSLKHEVADLKRKLGDHTIKSGPAVAIATETIHMPKKEGTTPAGGISSVTSETVASKEIRIPPLTEAARPPMISRLPKAQTGAVKPATGAVKPKTGSVTPAAEAKADDAIKAPVPVTRITASVKLPPLAETPPPPPARHTSPLAAIVAATPPVEKKDGDGTAAPATDSVPASTTPARTDLPVAPLPAVVVFPELDSRLGLIYKTKPEKIDDLTAIKGVTDVLAQRLHEFGIYTYEQIAAWHEDQIREFSARLAFKDRIQRERWVEQAQQLAGKKVTQHA
jgi:predicted flap endonuclease-1-like 5' DNA nuclease